ncbi:helix-turn-helix domain-containing protein [Boseaceae bacterium BT-24-1]|nr:helix-turn-helix domain-containing protein [Boseaceae bacterium BT-24-1]
MLSEFLLITPLEAAAKIGESVRQHRIARNITQTELAERASVSVSTLKRIEADGSGSLRDVMAIAIELNIEHDILNAIPRPPLRSLDDLDAAGHRIQRVRARASRASR